MQERAHQTCFGVAAIPCLSHLAHDQSRRFHHLTRPFRCSASSLQQIIFARRSLSEGQKTIVTNHLITIVQPDLNRKELCIDCASQRSTLDARTSIFTIINGKSCAGRTDHSEKTLALGWNTTRTKQPLDLGTPFSLFPCNLNHVLIS